MKLTLNFLAIAAIAYANHVENQNVPGGGSVSVTMAQGYTIKPVLEGDVEGVMTLLKKTFFIDEPLNTAVGLCENNAPCTELEEYCTHSILEGLSFRAVDGQENTVGVTISGFSPLKEEQNGNDLRSQAQNCKNPKFQKILYILACREKCAKLWEHFPNDQKLVEVKVAATDPAWRRKGIMTALVKETERATVSKGMRLLRLDTSSAYSAKAAERLGFTYYYSRKYTNIKKNGVPLIVPAAPHLYDRVYVKELST